ncbi:MAG: nitroreductase family protein [Thermoplasmata archaeon]|nr:MAG: nitroreductase family protein [Thermoplasmata archaeon]
MELSEVISKRTSVRYFKDEPIRDDIIRDLIEAAIKAPTASALENWLFVVIKNKEKLSRLYEILEDAHLFYYKLRGATDEVLERLKSKIREGMYRAPIYIAVFVDRKIKITSGDKEYEDLEFIFAVESASAAMENLILRAVEHGLGTCWIGVASYSKYMKEVCKICDVPSERYFLVGLIALGYPLKIQKRERKKSIEEVLRFV